MTCGRRAGCVCGGSEVHAQGIPAARAKQQDTPVTDVRDKTQDLTRSPTLCQCLLGQTDGQPVPTPELPHVAWLRVDPAEVLLPDPEAPSCLSPRPRA